jgi:hypothetical protein
MYTRHSFLASLVVAVAFLFATIHSLPLESKEQRLARNDVKGYLSSDNKIIKNRRPDLKIKREDTQGEVDNESDEHPKKYSTIQELLSNQKPLGKLSLLHIS